MECRPYPRLGHLLRAYFHQDCYLDAADDAEILADYKSVHSKDEIRETIADIERLLACHPTGLLEAAERLFRPDIILGGSDAQARDWFERILVYLRADDAARPPAGGPTME